MSLADLSPDEDLVLLAWVREIVQVDGQYSAQERAEVQKLRALLGEQRFAGAMRAAEEKILDRGALKAGAKRVTRAEARRAIYAFLRDLAASDTVTPEEERPLRWLASWWDLG